MIRTNLALLLGGLLCVAPLQAATVPRPSPEYAVKLSAQKQVLLSQYRGKVVLLMFFLTTCPHCQTTSELVERLNKEYGPRGLQPLAVAFNANAEALVPDFVRTYGLTFPVGYDQRDTVYSYLDRQATQRTFVPIVTFIDRKGVIRHQHFGDDAFFRNQEANIRALVEQLLRELGAASRARPRKKTP